MMWGLLKIELGASKRSRAWKSFAYAYGRGLFSALFDVPIREEVGRTNERAASPTWYFPMRHLIGLHLRTRHCEVELLPSPHVLQTLPPLGALLRRSVFHSEMVVGFQAARCGLWIL